MEQQLVEFLKEKYRPHIIVLAGSRVNETHTEKSDWDLFLFCDTKGIGGISKWNNQELDIAFHEWPKPKEWIFTNPYSPVWPLPPAQALPFIRENDPEFWELLSGFVKTNGRESATGARVIATRLQAA